MLGPGSTSQAMAVSDLIGQFPANQRYLLISASATGNELSNKTRYPSFFRIIPPDKTQVQVKYSLKVFFFKLKNKMLIDKTLKIHVHLFHFYRSRRFPGIFCLES
jgi:hypothetical protein